MTRGAEGRTRLRAGVDEAGLGPLLGPLAIGFSVLRLPEPASDPWKLLKRVVARKPPKRGKRLVVADSKLVFQRSATGRARLERTALSFLSLSNHGGEPPTDARELLFHTFPAGPGLLDRHPWYAALPELPWELESASVELATALARRELDAQGVELVEAGVRVVPSGELNAGFQETNNKAATIWTKCLEVLRHLWMRHAEDDLDVTVDLLGGRMRYAPQLEGGFPEATVDVLHERPTHSAYLLRERDADGSRWLPRRMRVEFLAKGDVRSFTTALASCCAKYARELVMTGFNAYFAERAPDVRPTAGYRTDGERWLGDVRPLLGPQAIPETVLIRQR